jgi:hypothetical protein
MSDRRVFRRGHRSNVPSSSALDAGSPVSPLRLRQRSSAATLKPPLMSEDASFRRAGRRRPGLFTGSAELRALAGAPARSSAAEAHTGDVGDDAGDRNGGMTVNDVGQAPFQAAHGFHGGLPIGLLRS